MIRTRVKFCGMTRPGDARLAVELGVDAIGLVFAQRSPRSLDITQALAVRAAIPPLVTTVAVFMDNEPSLIERVIRSLQPSVLQFHGSETAAECARWGLPWVRAIGAGEAEQVQAQCARFADAAGFVLDSHAPGMAGGTGQTFDWSRLSLAIERPWWLAGGLTADNVGTAIRMLRPHAVDVSSGIESAPGRKDGDKMLRFILEVKRADDE